MKIYFYLIIPILLFCISCSGSERTSKEHDSISSFKLPSIPSPLTKDDDKTKYLVAHYWDNYKFCDSSVVNNDSTLKFFNEYLILLQKTDSSATINSIINLSNKIFKPKSKAYPRFDKLFNDFLDNPNSYYRSETLFRVYLTILINSNDISDIEKERHIYRLKILNKNRISTKATNFDFITKKWKTSSLYAIKSNYIIIYFNDPHCHECIRVSDYFSKSLYFNKWANTLKNNIPLLTILGVFTGSNITEWKDHSLPSDIIDAYNPRNKIEKDELFDLRAMPTLYLLNKDKIVILKDSPIEQIEEYLYYNIHLES